MARFQQSNVENVLINDGNDNDDLGIPQDLKNKYSTVDQFIGQKLRDFREKVGLTLKDCSDRVGISHQQIHKYESGQTKIPSGMLYKFCKLFAVSANDFFIGYSGDENENSEPLPIDITTYRKTRKVNILLVDHHSEDQFQIIQSLEGFKDRANLYCIHDGAEFMNIIKSRSTISNIPIPDIIFFDLDIPKMEGISLLKYIKQDKQLKHIPVLLITSSINIKDVMSSYKNYAAGYIRKSFDFDVFKKHMQFALNYWTEAVVLPHHEWNE